MSGLWWGPADCRGRALVMEGDLSVTEVVTETGGLPTFELDYRYDDPADPDEVTIYDTDAEEPTTTWVTVSIEDTVSLDTVA